MFLSLEVTRLDGATVYGVGARGMDRLQDVVDRYATVVASGGGTSVALVLVLELVVARRTYHMPNRTLHCITKQMHHALIVIRFCL